MYDINDYIQGIVPLGSPLFCPFHDDRHPSAYCTPSGLFYCFVCCISGDQLECIKRIHFPNEGWAEGLSLASAFMKRYGSIQYVYKKEETYIHPEPQIIEVMSLWQKLCNNNLKNSPLLSRIKEERGLKDPLNLGLGLANFDSFLKISKEVEEKQLIDCGIVHPPDSKGLSFRSRYKLSNRIIIPEIRRSKTIYYQSRAQEKEHKVRYLNPKGLSRPIFGWESIYRKTSFVWFVEGVFDMLPLIEAGESVICCNGLGFNDQILHDIDKVIDNRPIAIVFDNDKPDARGERRGQIEGLKRVEKFKSIGINAKSLTPPYKDVGEWITIKGVEEVVSSITLQM